MTAIPFKDTVRAATVGSNITLTLAATATLDGVTLAAGNRVLVKDQTSGAANGVYFIPTGATSLTWTRAYDSHASLVMASGHSVIVSEGTLNAGTEWTCTTAAPISLGSTVLVYKRIDGAWDEWETLYAANSIMVSAGVVGTYVLKVDGTVAVVSSASLVGGSSVFPLDPTQYAVTGKTIQVRVVGHVLCVGTAPLSTMNFSLIPISSVASGVPTLAAASGSSGTVAAPTANAMTAVYGTAFTMPAAGTYCLACVTTTATNAATQQHLRAALQVRAI